MGSLFGLDKLFPQLFENNILVYGMITLVVIVGYFYFKKGEKKTDMKMFYFAEVERLVTPLDISELSPKSITTKDEKKFMRRAKSWLYKFKSQTYVMWLGKVGKGITYRLEQNKKDEAGNAQVEKIGSLYDGLKHCLDVKEVNELTPQTFTPESLELLKKSEIFVCVDLEHDTKDMPEITEEMATREADKSMMDLVGMKIRQHMAKEDWIRNAGMMAIGALAYIILGQLGLMG